MSKYTFQYWKHENKSDIFGSLVFEYSADSLTESDTQYSKETGKDPKKQPDIGVTVQEN